MFGKRLNFLTVSGIKIGVDFSWLFIALLLSWSLAVSYFPHYFPGLHEGSYWLMGILGMLGLFVCIVLHELGHGLVAKHYELPISSIVLFVFGGVAEIKREPQSAKIEFLMAIAGPIVSLVLAILMYLLSEIGQKHGWPLLFIGVTGYLAWINTVLVIFNMIPAFPLDGGRIFRSILWGWTQNLGLATKISTTIGSLFGYFLIFFGIFLFIGGDILGGVWSAILGLFLKQAASSSRTQFMLRKELQGEKVSKFMSTPPISVPPNISLKEFIDQHVYKTHHHLYPVTENGTLLGYISLDIVKAVPAEKWVNTALTQVMVPLSKFQTVSPDLNAFDALNLLQQDESNTLLVADKNEVVGVLTIQDLLKLISLKLELEEPS